MPLVVLSCVCDCLLVAWRFVFGVWCLACVVWYVVARCSVFGDGCALVVGLGVIVFACCVLCVVCCWLFVG